jgi:RNA polymerase sigma-70 factor (ECF subfamily)
MPHPQAKEKPTLDENLLVEAARRGNREAARALYDRHEARVWRVVYRLVLDREETRDICQETWLKAFASISRFEGRSEFGTWVLRIALNCTRSWARRLRTRRKAFEESSLSGGVEALPSSPPGQRRLIDEGRHQAWIERALTQLAPKQRQAFVLRHFEDLPLAEISRLLGCREGSVKSHLNRAVRKLRTALQPIVEGREKDRETPERQ